MKCPECSKIISAYLDGAVGGKERAKVDAHLDLCPFCREELLELQALKSRLRGMNTPVAREGFWESVYAYVGQCSHDCRISWWQMLCLPQVRIPALAAAAVALITLGLSLGVGRFGRNEFMAFPLLLSEHARYSVMQPLSDPGRMNYLQVDSNLSSLDAEAVTLVSEER